MTSRKTGAKAPDGPDARATDAKAAAAARKAKGSVQQAIGTLMGDDIARARGAAEQQAGADDASAIDRSSRS
ncbi:MAG: hypothetical protein ABW173_01370 [Sphingomonas sp.]